MKDRILSTRLFDDQIAFFYLGQEGFILKADDKYLMIDAYLTGQMAAPGIHWGRNYPAPIGPEELDFVDYVVCSHDHMDHTDYNTLRGLLKVNAKAKFLIPASFAAHAAEEGVPADRIIGAREFGKVEFGPFTVEPLASAHEDLETDGNGDFFAMGYKISVNGITLYHSGDCCIYRGLAEKVGKVDICMLPVNGRSYYKLRENCIGNMTLEEAVLFSKEAEAKFFIPMHFDMFAVNSIPAGWIPDGVAQYNPGICYHIFTPGERYIY